MVLVTAVDRREGERRGKVKRSRRRLGGRMESWEEERVGRKERNKRREGNVEDWKEVFRKGNGRKVKEEKPKEVKIITLIHILQKSRHFL